MNPQLYLNNNERKYFKKQIEWYFSFLLDGLECFQHKFEKSEPDIDELKKKRQGNSMDNGNLNEMDEQYDYWITYCQHYCSFYEQFLGFSFVQLYHFWEKQIRGFLYKEMDKDIESITREKRKKNKTKTYQTGVKKYFKERVINLKNIQCMFNKYDINIKKYHLRDTISLLNKINNTYKHGWGLSAVKISDLIKYENNLDIILKINSNLLIKCKDAICNFRDFIPEKSDLVH